MKTTKTLTIFSLLIVIAFSAILVAEARELPMFGDSLVATANLLPDFPHTDEDLDCTIDNIGGYDPDAFLFEWYEEGIYKEAWSGWGHDTLSDSHTQIGETFRCEIFMPDLLPPYLPIPISQYYHDTVTIQNRVPWVNLVSPADGSTDMPNHVTLQWNGGDPDPSEEEYVHYEVWFGTNPSSLGFVGTTGNKNYPIIDLEYSTTYYWQIIVNDLHGGVAYSEIWHFMTMDEILPPTVDIIAPQNNAVINVDDVLMAYEIGQADPEDVRIYLDGNVIDVFQQNIGIHSFEYQNLAYGLHDLKVEVENTAGSDSDEVTIEVNRPPYVNLISPTDGASNQPLSLTLDWEGGDPNTGDTVTYTIYFGTNPNPGLWASDLTASQYPVSNLIESTTYYWKVKVKDNHGKTVMSPTWDFDTETPYNPPHINILSPSEGFVSNSQDVTLTYNIDQAGVIRLWDGTNNVYTTGNNAGTYSYLYENLDFGDHTLKADITNSNGDDSDQVNIYVNEEPIITDISGYTDPDEGVIDFISHPFDPDGHDIIDVEFQVYHEDGNIINQEDEDTDAIPSQQGSWHDVDCVESLSGSYWVCTWDSTFIEFDDNVKIRSRAEDEYNLQGPWYQEGPFTIHNAGPLMVTAEGIPDTGLEPLEVQFNCDATGGVEPYSYHWTFGDGDESFWYDPVHEYENDGSYTAVCTVEDSNNNQAAAEVEITVLPDVPDVTLTAIPTGGIAPLTVEFTCNVQGGNPPFIFDYVFGDEPMFQTERSVPNPGDIIVHTYQNPGVYTAICTVTDENGNGETGSDSVDITVTQGNQAPTAYDDDYETDEDVTLVINPPGVLGNDEDPDNDPLTAILVDNVAHGILSFNSDGSFTYTPDEDGYGNDYFTYMAFDGELNSNIALVNITVHPVNDPPVAYDDWYETDMNEPLIVSSPGILGNDHDTENDPLTAILITNVQHGTLSLDSDGSFVYVPESSGYGDDYFTYKANDGQLNSNTATVHITVHQTNEKPQAYDDYYDTDEDVPLIIDAPGVLGNDFDPDGDPLTAILVDDVLHGTLSLDSDGSFAYNPNDDGYGEDWFTYMANDGQANSNVATVHITVHPVNDPPVAYDDYYDAEEQVPLVINAPGVLANDHDTENDPLTAILVSPPTSGDLTFNSDGSFVYTSWPLTEKTLCESPDCDDEFTYMANDGEFNSNVATVHITLIAGANTPPIANDDWYETDQDVTLSVDAPGVLINDDDAENDPLSAILVSDVQHGTLNLDGDGSFVYVPESSGYGDDYFTYKANDGEFNSNTATVHITVHQIISEVHDVALYQPYAPSSANAGEDVVFKTKVENQGTEQEDSIVRFFVDEVEQVGCREYFYNLDPGDITQLYSCTWNAEEGTHVLKIGVDIVNGETDVDDNVFHKTITVGLDPIHDLAVKLPVFPNFSLEGETVTWSTKVENQGNVQEDSTLRFFIDGFEETQCRTTISNIAPGDVTSRYSCSWVAEEGFHTTKVEIDPVPGETDLADNSAQSSFDVGNNPPHVNAYASPQSGDSPLTVYFDCLVDNGNAPFYYEWDFGDGGSSYEKDPVHTYYDIGAFEATCTVTDDDGDVDSDFVTIWVDEPQGMSAYATADPIEGYAPLLVGFTCEGQGGVAPYNYYWDFGDGDGSYWQNPTHEYTLPGYYQAECLVTDSQGNTATDGGPIDVRGDTHPVAVATADPTSGFAPLLVNFGCEGSEGNPPYSYEWDFGDGEGSYWQNPTHEYTSQGSYFATCTVTDNDGDHDTDGGYIDVYAPENVEIGNDEKTDSTGLSTSN